MPVLPTAEEFWAMDDPWIAGRLFFDRIPPEQFPRWASRILRIAWSRCPDPSPAFEQLVLLLMESQDWPRAKGIFSAIRETTLHLEALTDPDPEQRIRLRVCALAENIAKATYNLGAPADPFTDDAGHWIAGCLRDVATHVTDDRFRNLAWSALLG